MMGVLTLIFLWCKILQLKDLEVYTVIRVIFQLAEEIPCISAVVIALLSEVHLQKCLKNLVIIILWVLMSVLK